MTNFEVGGPITPFIPNTPTHYSNNGIGGWHEVEDITERNAIPVDSVINFLNEDGVSSGKRRIGMLVWVRNTGSGSSNFFQLQISNWDSLTLEQKYSALADNNNWKGDVIVNKEYVDTLINSSNVNTTYGDITYYGTNGNTRLAGNITTSKRFLSQIGDGSTSGDPTWVGIISDDIENIDSTKISGILNSDVGGTGNGFTKFTGATGIEKVYTLPNANTTILTTANTVTVQQGGTGQTTPNAAFAALSPTTTVGDIIYYGTAGNTRLPGNNSNTRMFLSQTGNGTASSTPIWIGLSSNDIPNLDANKITSGILLSQFGGTGNSFTKFTGASDAEKTYTLPNQSTEILTTVNAVTVQQGGTGLQSLTANAVILGNGTGTPNFVTGGSNGHHLEFNGTTWISAAPKKFRPTTISGTQNGINKVFTIGVALESGSEMITYNGQVLNPGNENDYVLSGLTLTFNSDFPDIIDIDTLRIYGIY